MAFMVAKETARRKGHMRRSPKANRGGSGGVVFDLRVHGGKWVATQRGAVIAAAETLPEINRLLDEAGIGNDVVLTKVPRTGDFAL